VKKVELPSDLVLSSTKEKQLQNILEAAEQCFIEQGIALTTMKDISLRANIYRRTLYNYFQSKEDVAFAIHKNYNQNGLKFIASGIGTGYEQLDALITFLMDHMDELLPRIHYEIQYEFYMHHIAQSSFAASRNASCDGRKVSLNASCQSSRQDAEMKNFPVVAQSSFAVLEQSEQFIKAGIDLELINTLTTVLKLGLADGSIVLPEADLDMTVYSILQAIIGYLQRVVHREDVFVKESGFSREHWGLITKIILRGIKA